MSKYVKKFELTEPARLLGNGELVYQIRALCPIERFAVSAGDLGGFVSGTHNLSENGDAWIDENACVTGESIVMGDAYVTGDAQVTGKSLIAGVSNISGRAELYNVNTSENVCILGNAVVRDSKLSGTVVVEHYAALHRCSIKGTASISDFAVLNSVETVADGVLINGNAKLTRTIIGIEGDSTNSVVIGDNVEVNDCTLSGRSLRLSNSVLVENGAYFSGTDIVLSDFAQVNGNVELGSHVAIRDFVKILNHSQKALSFKNETLTGDVVITN